MGAWPHRGWAHRQVGHDWRADPFSRGAYSYTQVGGGEANAPVVEDTLYYAGEDFACGTIGTVEGALETGEAAAEAIRSQEPGAR